MKLSEDRITTAFFLVGLFILFLLGWGPLQAEVHLNALDPDLTNALWLWLDSWFGLWWGFMLIMILGLALWTLVKDF